MIGRSRVRSAGGRANAVLGRLIRWQLVWHPACQTIEYRVVGDLTNGEVVTDSTFSIGGYTGISDEMIDYVVATFREFVQSQA